MIKTKKNITFFIFLCLSFALWSKNIKKYKIGVLAKRGPQICCKKWIATADYLSISLPDTEFEIVPLNFDEIYSTVEKKEVDFVIANPYFYVNLEARYDASRIATLKNKKANTVCTDFGGVIFTLKNSGLKTIDQLHNKTFMAVHSTSLGGYQMACKELKNEEIFPCKHFKDIKFGGTHDSVVYAVLNGKVDAGTVRTDTLERMEREGKINMGDFYILSFQGNSSSLKYKEFPFVYSTPLYPEWPFAKLSDTPDELAEQVTAALLIMSEHSRAAKNAKCAGWTIPLNYNSVHELLKELRLPPYENLGNITIKRVVKEYFYWLLASFSGIFAIIMVLIYLKRLNGKLAHSNTLRKAALDALAESEDRLSKALIAINDGVWDWNLENGQVFFNDLYYKMAGYEPNEFPASFDEFIKRVHPLDCEYLQKTLDKHLEMKSKDYVVEFRFRKKNGDYIWLLSRGNVMEWKEDGSAKRMIGTHTDITERKNAEFELEHLQEFFIKIIDSMPSMIISVNSDGIITQWNNRVSQLTGISHEDAFGKLIIEIFPRAKKIMHLVEKSIKENEVYQEQIRDFSEDGSVIYEHITVYPLEVQKKEGAVIRIDDITEQTHLEEIMVQSEKMLSVGGLAAGMAHEINNPLAGMMQTATVIKNRLGEQNISANEEAAKSAGLSIPSLMSYMEKRKIFEMLDRIMESGKKAANIVDKVLTFSSRGDKGFEEADIKQLLLEAVDLAGSDYLLKKKYNFKEIKMEYFFDFVPTVICDPSKIQQVFLSIIRNGAEAMSDVENVQPKMTFRLSFSEKMNLLHIEIEDNGSGIDEKTQNRIFEPFFTTKPTDCGTGLGLSVSYFIITQIHKGNMWVESSPGNGAKFIIELPIL